MPLTIKPKIYVPVGDPAGIGPEIALKAASELEIKESIEVVLVGNKDMLLHECNRHDIDHTKLLFHDTGAGPVIPRYGCITPECGHAAWKAVKIAAEMAMNDTATAIATAPINKESVRAFGINTIGHTELLGEFTKTSELVTVFKTNELTIFFLTRHISLRKFCDFVTFDNVYKAGINILKYSELIKTPCESRPIAIAGINPHNGEHGMFGDEEDKILFPVVAAFQRDGYNVVGPIPADSVFSMAIKGKYSSVISLYHDQGHIAAKTYDFENTISLTLGMPFLRTSVDHGTAFDIAGKGVADFTGMKQAIITAARTGQNYRINYKKRLERGL